VKSVSLVSSRISLALRHASRVLLVVLNPMSNKNPVLNVMPVNSVPVRVNRNVRSVLLVPFLLVRATQHVPIVLLVPLLLLQVFRSVPTVQLVNMHLLVDWELVNHVNPVRMPTHLVSLLVLRVLLVALKQAPKQVSVILARLVPLLVSLVKYNVLNAKVEPIPTPRKPPRVTLVILVIPKTRMLKHLARNVARERSLRLQDNCLVQAALLVVMVRLKVSLTVLIVPPDTMKVLPERVFAANVKLVNTPTSQALLSVKIALEDRFPMLPLRAFAMIANKDKSNL
jgi:hypothetical protein